MGGVQGYEEKMDVFKINGDDDDGDDDLIYFCKNLLPE